jgi:lysophospholipase L1-like esterase
MIWPGLVRTAAALMLALAVVATACSSDGDSSNGGAAGTSPTTQPTGPPPVYVAVGASETAGFGSEVPLRDGWTRVLFRMAMPAHTVFVNMGVPGATVSQALRESLPMAVDQRPTVATVWLNVNDIIAGVGPAEFERDLGTLVRTLRRGGATRVLVANTPPIDRLPAYLACRPDPPASAPPCRVDFELPPPELVNLVVAAYNAATGRVVEREGAHLVDLHAVAMAARQAGIDQALVSNDGFHPNAGGHQAVATAFAEVLRATGPLPDGGS